jgi:hypothetical protein
VDLEDVLVVISALLAFPPQWCQVKAGYCYENNIEPQIAIYNSGDFSNADRWLIRTEILRKPYFWLILPSLPGCFSMNTPEEAMESLVAVSVDCAPLTPIPLSDSALPAGPFITRQSFQHSCADMSG